MSAPSDLSKEELRVIAEVVELWELIVLKLSQVNAWPRDNELHIHSRSISDYLGWVGHNEGGDVTFQPASGSQP